MSELLRRMLHVIGLDFAAQADREIDARQEALASDVAVRYGRGNVHIQDRQVLTREELDREVEELTSLELARN